MPPSLSSATSMPELIRERAVRHGDRIAVTFVADDRSDQSWSYKELWWRACAVARALPTGVEPQSRALLLYPPGIEFVSAFLGCQIAGWVPVPTCYPRGGREMMRLDSVAIDCKPAAILSDVSTLADLRQDRLCEAVRVIPKIATDSLPFDSDPRIISDSLSIDPNDLALLQYTSGSTSEPKGVMVRHRNLMSNLEAIREGFHIEWQADDTADPDTGVFWLPFFHDMGLIGGILEPLYVGGRSILMSPRSFLQRPIRWLQYISDYRAVISGAPNFAYQLCVDRVSPEQTDSLDLERWRIAFSGAEPVLPRTLHDFANRFASSGFSPNAFLPCYGLAEATLLAACGDGPSEPKVLNVDRESLSQGLPRVIDGDAVGATNHKIVSCGSPARETELLIVDPATMREASSCVVGEIWLRGSSVTDGYWNRANENEERFHASLEDGRDGYCRTGDLGFLHDGELYVTGRLKDLIIIGGRNLFPQDIEDTVHASVGSRVGKCAAFAVDANRGEALAMLVEVPRQSDESTYPDLARAIRRVVIEVHEVDPRHVLIVRQASIPLTSSGKVQRSRCRERFQDKNIRSLYRYDRHSGSTQSPIPIPDLPKNPQPEDRSRTQAAIESWMVEWLIARGGVPPGEVDLERPFAEYGLDSMTAVEMSGDIEDWSGVELTPVIAWNHPSVSRLSSFITDQLMGVPSETENKSAAESLEALLSEIEQMSDQEANHALASKRRK